MAGVPLAVDKERVSFRPTDEAKVLYQESNTYVKLGSRNKKDEFVYGTLYILEKRDGVHVEWKPCNENNTGVGDSWAVIDSDDKEEFEVGHEATEGAATGNSKVDKLAHRIDFELNQLKSFKRITRTVKQPAYVIFILNSGLTHPAIFFHKGGSDKLITNLEKHVIVSQSHTDNNMFLVSQHQREALETSFDKLNLFDDDTTAMKMVHRFTSNPVKTTLSGFAKLTKIMSEGLVMQDPGRTMAPDFADELRMSIDESEETTLNTVTSSQPTDPDFCFIDEKVYLPEVPRRARDRPLDRRTWSSMFSSEGRLADPAAVKQLIFRGGVSHDLRSDVWKYLLGYYPWDSTTGEREELRRQKVDDYFAMKLQWKTMKEVQKNNFMQFRDRESLIEKDVNRTDRTTPFFSGDNNDKLVQLNDILMTYVMYNFDLGYVQGMSDLLSPLLLVMNNEVDAFWCFVGFMNLVESNFELTQQGMKLQMNQLNQILQIVDRKLYNYLDENDSSNMYFAFRWILILFKREFSMTDIMRLWEVYWTALPCENYQLVMAISLLTKHGSKIMQEEYGFTEILKHINDLSGEIDLNDFLCDAEVLAQQLMTCEKLPGYVAKIIGAEKSPHHSQSPSIDNLREHSSGSSGRSRTPPPRSANSPARNQTNIV